MGKTRPVLIMGLWAALGAALLLGVFSLDCSWYIRKHPGATFSQWLVGKNR